MKVLELNRTNILYYSYSSNLFPSVFGAHLSELTFIIKIIHVRAQYGHNCCVTLQMMVALEAVEFMLWSYFERVARFFF